MPKFSRSGRPLPPSAASAWSIATSMSPSNPARCARAPSRWRGSGGFIMARPTPRAARWIPVSGSLPHTPATTSPRSIRRWADKKPRRCYEISLKPGGEKLPQGLRRHVGIFLGQEVTGIDRRARNIGGPILPAVERRGGGARDTRVAPQRQHRDRDLFSCFAIGLVDVKVGIGAGAVILAHRVHARGIAKRRKVMFKRPRIDRVERLRLGLARHLLLEEEVR